PSSSYTPMIEKLYIAYFGRPAAPAGMDYWAAQLVLNGGDLAPLCRVFYASSEYTAAHAGQSTEALIGSLFQNLFGRAPLPAGLSYWTGEIESGRVPRDQVALALLNNASSQDGAVLNNKLTAATTFTAHVDVLSELVAYHSGGAFNSAHTFLATVKTSVPSNATIDAAVLAAVTAGTP
ncbi:DUF4214 domain-containing protein, partial [bacterium]|nr:DUF4214 domain-containing protein [bacterium]